MALHEQSVGATDEWYTPPYVLDAFECTFDTDVASPGQHVTPWIRARSFITANSLLRPWHGYVWMNAPFGRLNELVPWLQKFFDHGNGIALVPDRTSAGWWQRFALRAELFCSLPPRSSSLGLTGQELSQRTGPACWLWANKVSRHYVVQQPTGSALMAAASGAREAWQSLPLFEQSRVP
jgi:hypothetical protein